VELLFFDAVISLFPLWVQRVDPCPCIVEWCWQWRVEATQDSGCSDRGICLGTSYFHSVTQVYIKIDRLGFEEKILACQASEVRRFTA